MAKFTKKWLKDFEKRYKNLFKELDNMEKEYQEMAIQQTDWNAPKFAVYGQINFGNKKFLPKLANVQMYECNLIYSPKLSQNNW